LTNEGHIDVGSSFCLFNSLFSPRWKNMKGKSSIGLCMVIQIFIFAGYKPVVGDGAIFPTESRFMCYMKNIFVLNHATAISGNLLHLYALPFSIPKMGGNLIRARICFINIRPQYKSWRNLEFQCLRSSRGSGLAITQLYPCFFNAWPIVA